MSIELAIPTVLPDGMDLRGYALMGLLVMAGACMQGVGGIGFSMLSAPIAVLAYAAMVPGPLLHPLPGAPQKASHPVLVQTGMALKSIQRLLVVLDDLGWVRALRKRLERPTEAL